MHSHYCALYCVNNPSLNHFLVDGHLGFRFLLVHSAAVNSSPYVSFQTNGRVSVECVPRNGISEKM